MPNDLAMLVSPTLRITAFALLIAAGVSVAGCCASHASVDDSMHDVAHKLDAPLRAELRGAREHAVIGVLLGLESASEEHLSRLINDGLEIQTTTANIVTARGTRGAILRAARNTFVQRIDLSRERPGSNS